ncbi:MAG: hypothetical protein ABIU63_14570 [Chitinophagaceae bacterium]
MKKKICLLFLAIISLTACQKELSFETAGTASGGGGTAGGGGTGGASSTDCKSCMYMPVCDGAAYTYADTSLSVASLVVDSFRFVKDTIIDNKTFVKIYSPSTKTDTYYNCTDGATRVIAYNASTVGGNNVSLADITFIKANLPVGATWQDKLKNPSGQEVTYSSKITEKGIKRVVNGQVFNDVIHVTMESGLDIPLVGFTTFTATDYYFAKGIGLIETITKDPNSGTVIQHRALKDYYIP